ncbi:MAG: glycerol-3-phosphate 1-O-acyltransferase PlsY [Candidatus Omnitrophota bacterium]|nr:glycerol-3-phosphate 1-O-acyltransferase PlsY [bacterium]MBU3930140.1 glycerol-3-phosphate 1-O-acyltransferase PlsY [bacterium]MBU4123028.1 glycerol-3-phosphate 1-O-acyltransferase PlsY [bacterium]
MTVFLIIAAFIAGSVPFGWIYVKLFKGRDVRELGSGSTGATNVYRAAGLAAALLVFFLDFAKGFIFPFFFGGSYALKIALGLIVILGHNFSIFLKGRGGKGVASSAGVAAALAPFCLLSSFAVFVFVFIFSRIISFSSIIAAGFFPVFCFVFGMPTEIKFFALATFVFVVFSHRSNIRRLFSGEEKRIVKP